MIVVDDCSNSDYRWLPEPVVLLKLPTWRGPGGARNAGVALAKADVVALLDDDQTVPSEWLAELLEALLMTPEASAAGSYVRPPDPALARSAPARLEFQGLAAAGCFAPGGMARADRSPVWKRQHRLASQRIFSPLGGFREAVGAGEDGDLAARAGAAGHQTVFIHCPATHWRSYTWRDLWSQHVRRASRMPDAGRAVGRIEQDYGCQRHSSEQPVCLLPRPTWVWLAHRFGGTLRSRSGSQSGTDRGLDRDLGTPATPFGRQDPHRDVVRTG